MIHVLAYYPCSRQFWLLYQKHLWDPEEDKNRHSWDSLIFHLLVLSRAFHVSLETVVLCIFLCCGSGHWRFIHPFQLSQLGLIISQIALQGWEAQFQANPKEYMILSALLPWSPPASLELGYGVLPDDQTLTNTFISIFHLFQPFCINVLKAFWRHDGEAG